jgi:hypothetical protein
VDCGAVSVATDDDRHFHLGVNAGFSQADLREVASPEDSSRVLLLLHRAEPGPSRYGRNLIEPVRSRDDVSGYASKYLTKNRSDDCWWDVKLQWHRIQAIQRSSFKLCDDVSRSPVRTGSGNQASVNDLAHGARSLSTTKCICSPC